jgi:hypothetical protein
VLQVDYGAIVCVRILPCWCVLSGVKVPSYYGTGCLSGHVVDICTIRSRLCSARQHLRRYCVAFGHSGTYAAFQHSFLTLFTGYLCDC